MKDRMELSEEEYKTLKDELAKEKKAHAYFYAECDNLNDRGLTLQEEHTTLVRDFNTLVDEYNLLLAKYNEGKEENARLLATPNKNVRLHRELEHYQALAEPNPSRTREEVEERYVYAKEMWEYCEQHNDKPGSVHWFDELRMLKWFLGMDWGTIRIGGPKRDPKLKYVNLKPKKV